MAKGKTHNVLLVEDDLAVARVYEAYLQDEPYDVVHVETGTEALKLIDQAGLDVVILDLHLPDMNGIEILKHIHTNIPNLSVIVITAHGSINTAVDAMRMGASDFLMKPFDPARFIYTISNAIERNQLSKIVKSYKDEFDRHEYEGFIGASLAMLAIYKTIDAAAPSHATVFIKGESGTGKEVCAAAIHARSDRSDKPFIALNCAAIPSELMESEVFGHVKGAFTGAAASRDGAATLADGGTLFLDEICEMDQALQAKLLRFIQTGTFQKVGSSTIEDVNVRFVCATNKDPWEQVRQGNFREDLYFRLHVVPISLPPLRERDDDVISIAQYFLAQFSAEEGKSFTSFSAQTKDAMLNYQWPGNVRELQNILRLAVIMNAGEEIGLEMMPQLLAAEPSGAVQATAVASNQASAATLSENSFVPGGAATGMDANNIIPLWQVEQAHIQRALDHSEGNVARAAAILEIGTSTLYRRLKEMGISV